MTTSVAPPSAYADAFEAVERGQTVPAPVADRRRQAFTRFSSVGVPTTKLEQWRFTNVSSIASTTFAPAGPATVPDGELARFELGELSAGWPTAVFVNGRYEAALSTVEGLADGVVVDSLAAVWASPSAAETAGRFGSAADIESPAAAFVALNTALASDGVVVCVPPHVVVDKPLHLLFLTVPPDRGARVMTHPRVLVVAGEHSQVRVVESYGGVGETPYFTNAVTEVVVGARAVVDHYKLGRESRASYHIGSMYVRLAREATFSSHAITLGGGLVRNEVVARLDGPGGTCTLNGLYLVDGTRLVDNQTTIHHAQPHCQSYELYKGILDGKSRAVFNGKIIVAIDAQKTDAKQTNKALLLSEDAQINTKPELEIFADDVRCTHGATVGQLDADALFYLRARGLSLEQARRLLIQAFAGDLLGRIGVAPLRARLEDLLLAQLPDAGEHQHHAHG